MSQIYQQSQEFAGQFDVEAQAIAQLLYLKSVIEAEHDTETDSQNFDAQEAWAFANSND